MDLKKLSKNAKKSVSVSIIKKKLLNRMRRLPFTHGPIRISNQFKIFITQSSLPCVPQF
jgi:hypothetical protein